LLGALILQNLVLLVLLKQELLLVLHGLKCHTLLHCCVGILRVVCIIKKQRLFHRKLSMLSLHLLQLLQLLNSLQQVLLLNPAAVLKRPDTFRYQAL